MAYGWVLVHGPDGRDVYVNGGYAEPNGKTGDWFTVEFGRNTFETLDDAGNVELRADAEVDDQNRQVEVHLAPRPGPDAEG